MACRFAAFCTFINETTLKNPSQAAKYKISYCNSNSANCARYLISRALGRQSLPDDLLPEEMNRAERIVLEKNKQK